MPTPQSQYIGSIQQQPPIVVGNQFNIVPQTNALLALILACLSFLTCGICLSIPALIMANKALMITNSIPGHPDANNAKAARVVSIINIVLSAILIVVYLVIGLAFASEFDDSTYP